MTAGSRQRPKVAGTGTGVPARAEITRCSRPMSWAEGEDPVQGRAPQHPAQPGGVVDPVGQVGAAPGDQGDPQRRPGPGTFAWNQAVTPARSMPGIMPVTPPRRPGGFAAATPGATPRSNTLGTMYSPELVVVHPGGDRPPRPPSSPPRWCRPRRPARPGTRLEGEHVVDLVGPVAASGGDHGGVAAGAGRVDSGSGLARANTIASLPMVAMSAGSRMPGPPPRRTRPRRPGRRAGSR